MVDYFLCRLALNCIIIIIWLLHDDCISFFLKICNFMHGAGRNFIALRIGIWKDDGGIFQACTLSNQGEKECGRRDTGKFCVELYHAAIMKRKRIEDGEEQIRNLSLQWIAKKTWCNKFSYS